MSPATVSMSATSAPGLAFERATSTPKAIAVRVHELGIWRGLGWADLAGEVSEIAGGLRALGAAPGNPVGLVMANHPSWITSYLGIQAIGCVVVPVDPDRLADTVVTALEQSGAIGVICGDQEQFDKVDELQATGRAGGIRFLVVADTRGVRSLDSDSRPDVDRVLTLAQLRRRGAGFDARTAVAAVKPSDPAVWFDGKTETHADGFDGSSSVGERLGLSAGDRLLAQASFAQPFERAVSLFGLLRHGLSLAIGEGGALTTAEMNAVQPTVLHAAPGYVDTTARAVNGRIKAAKGLRKFALSRLKPASPASTLQPPPAFSKSLMLLLATVLAIIIWFAFTASMDDPIRIIVAVGIGLAAFLLGIVSGAAVIGPLRRQLGLSRVRAVVGSSSDEGASFLGSLGVPLLHPDSVSGAPR